mmetsp:Transcript_27308/g.31171  ORF Transcript_27308/g.31171 Transcript_27308/m.31171 type:complete len:210 (+) Transcript_27308:120-749(+)
MANLLENHKKILDELNVNPSEGLSRDEASKRRQDCGTSNIVDPPIRCPAWVCCLLPCIKYIPSMKKFREIQPDDAEVLRDSKWTRYDSASLVRGDIIRIMEGDTIPADCVLLSSEDKNEILIDMRVVTGEDSPKSIIAGVDGKLQPSKLYFGGRFLQGSATAAVIAVGPDTLLATLIEQKKFPPREYVLEHEEENNDGVALLPLAENMV